MVKFFKFIEKHFNFFVTSLRQYKFYVFHIFLFTNCFCLTLIYLFTFFYYIPECDFSKNYQIHFQDPASIMMSDLVDLHNYITFFLVLILLFVVYLFILSYLSCHNDFNFLQFFYINVDNFFQKQQSFYFIELSSYSTKWSYNAFKQSNNMNLFE